MQTWVSSDIDLSITSLGGLGDGIGSHDGKPVFVAKACAGDRLRVRLLSENREGFQAEIVDILSPGAERRDPPCGYFSRCGGCSLQHLIPETYRAFKTNMLQSALARAGYDMPAEVTFLPPRTRRRVEFKVADGKLAFFAPRSHMAVAVDECMLLVPALAGLIAPLNAMLAELSLAGLHALALTQADSGIDMTFIFRDAMPTLPPLQAWCAKLGVARICARGKEDKARVVAQVAPVEMRLGGVVVALPPDAFLQATAEGQAQLTDAALQGTLGATHVVDLFCGIGTYSFPLAARARVHAVEGDAAMAAAVRGAGITTECRDLFKRPLTAGELARFDAAVINPPRVGAKAQAEQLAASGISRIVMVSCNPASFARDAAILRKNGFTLAQAQGIDQFLWSQHIEIFAVFLR